MWDKKQETGDKTGKTSRPDSWIQEQSGLGSFVYQRSGLIATHKNWLPPDFHVHWQNTPDT